MLRWGKRYKCYNGIYTSNDCNALAVTFVTSAKRLEINKTVMDEKCLLIVVNVFSCATRLPAFINPFHLWDTTFRIYPDIIRIILSKLNHFIIRNQFTIMLIIDSF